MHVQMFVRLFIDENLDRTVPISRQPKEKVQAILDSCKRQFPEMQARARKRVRTYLKSCRRTKKLQKAKGAGDKETEQSNTLIVPEESEDLLVLSKESLSSPAYHLNSAAADRILSEALEAEMVNVKRMRQGLGPMVINNQVSDL